MYTRSTSSTLTVQESFAFPRVASRSTEPEVFTFERIPAQATALRSTVPIRPKKRCTRVMYPAKVRMHLPPPEKNQAKRWLLVLCLVVLWQIYTEEPCADAPLTAVDGPAASPLLEPSAEGFVMLMMILVRSCLDLSAAHYLIWTQLQQQQWKTTSNQLVDQF
uniref:Radiation-inducible immediate-early gene IEX-1 n=1 Tax=Stegastes partitus TaxID=144197 RepID=A0A3B5AWI1_9TELE